MVTFKYSDNSSDDSVIYRFNMDDFSQTPSQWIAPYPMKSLFWKYSTNFVILGPNVISTNRFILDMSNSDFSSSHPKEDDFRIEYSISGPDFDSDLYVVAMLTRTIKVIHFSSQLTIKETTLTQFEEENNPYMVLKKVQHVSGTDLFLISSYG